MAADAQHYLKVIIDYR